MANILISDTTVKILQLGIIGLGFLLAVLAFFLLKGLQKPRPDRAMTEVDWRIHNANVQTTKWFMAFAVLLCLIGFLPEVLKAQQSSNPQLSYQWQLVGRGDITAHDVLSETLHPEPTYPCNEARLGLSAVCWTNNCRYKSVLAEYITPTTGGNIGNVFRCTIKTQQ